MRTSSHMLFGAKSLIKTCLNLQGIDHEREKEMPLHNKVFEIGSRRVDFFVEEKIMVEIKAIVNLEMCTSCRQ